MGQGTDNKQQGASRNGAPSGPQCDYHSNIPVSPHVDFSLDSGGYEIPSGGSVQFELKCDVKFQDIEVSGHLKTDAGTLQSVLDHFNQKWTVSGKPSLSHISSNSDITTELIFKDANFEGRIDSDGRLQVIIQIVERNIGLGDISSTSELFHSYAVQTEPMDVGLGNIASQGSASVVILVKEAIHHFGIVNSEGHLAGYVEVEGESTLENQGISGKAETIDYPFIAGDNTLEPIRSDSGKIEVLVSVKALLIGPDPIQSASSIDVLYNIEGSVKLGNIVSESGKIDSITNVGGNIPTGRIISSGDVNFLGFVNVKGSLELPEISSVGRANQLGTIDGNLTGNIKSEGELEVRWFGWVSQEETGIGQITSKSNINFYREVKVKEAVSSFTSRIVSDGRALHFEERRVVGTSKLMDGLKGLLDLVHVVAGTLQTDIASEGSLEHEKPEGSIDLRLVDGNIRPFKDRILSSGSAYQINSVFGNLQSDAIDSFSRSVSTIQTIPTVATIHGDIRHLRGRIVSGYEDEDIIEQIYEVSKDRKLLVQECPPDPRYPVRLHTTDFNISQEEIKRGTAVFEFDFDFELDAVKEIKVWLKTPNGGHKLDTMRWNNKNHDRKAPHILEGPIRFRVPVHCISDIQNEFFLEIDFLDKTNEVVSRSRHFKERLSYIIPFQAHFDNREPYVNIADHVSLESRGGHSSLQTVTEYPKMASLVLDDHLVAAPLGTLSDSFETLYEEPKMIYLQLEERMKIVANGGITYFIKESDDLYNINIGG